MKQSVCLCLFILGAIITPLGDIQAQARGTVQSAVSGPLSESTLNINNLWFKARNDGVLGYDTVRETGLTFSSVAGALLYCDDLFWVGKVSDGRLPLIRTGGGTYRAGMVPGAILGGGAAEDPQSPSVRVYRIRSDYRTANLTSDAVSYFGVDESNVTPSMILALRTQYEKDWDEWPWQKGAPYSDRNRNGVMDPDEVRGLQNADQVIWFAYNDLDETACKNFAGGLPTGVEVQVTLWAYRGIPNLESVIFKRYRLVYKGTAHTSQNAVIDSMYLAQWFDVDIGNAGDDFAGSDSTLGLGYGYNGNMASVSVPPGLDPALGYALLQGPLVPGKENDRGTFDFSTRQNKRNLPMTSCSIHITGTGDGLNEPPSIYSYFYWNVARGLKNPTYSVISSTPWVGPEGRATTFMYSGDPETRTGWIAARPQPNWQSDFWGGDVRAYVCTGPFSMTVGESQEIVLVIVGSPTLDRYTSIKYLKSIARFLKEIYPLIGDYVAEYKRNTLVAAEQRVPEEFALSQNYPNPFNPSTQIRYSIPIDGNVTLTVFDLLGREVCVLRNGSQLAGNYALTWDGRNARGESVPSGVYFYKLTQGPFQLARKLLLIR